MKITLAKLKKLEACPAGIDWYKAQKLTDHAKICLALIKDNHGAWANWLIVRLMTFRQKRMYAIFAAEQVIDIYEKKYPNDSRPRNAINAARAVLKNPSKRNKDAAAAAAAAVADAAAYAADADAAYAAYAAADAAYAAAADAAYAAYAAADAAYAAAAYAAYAAYAYDDARKEMQVRIINYGLKIMRKP